MRKNVTFYQSHEAHPQKMNKEVRNVMKQRIREAVWKTSSGVGFQPQTSKDEILSRRLKIHYREATIIPPTQSRSTHIRIRSKCVIEILRDRDNIKDHMKDHILPGVQVSFDSSGPPSIQFLRWYDDYIFEDGDPETLEDDPEKHREYELDEDTKTRLRSAFSLVNRTMSSGSSLDQIHKYLKSAYNECYKERYVTETLMPNISITDVCVIDITNRDRGLVMSADIKKMSQYMTALLLPAVLVNFHENRLSTILWLFCHENKIQMTIEVITEEPNDPPDLKLDEEVREVIRLAAEDINNDKTVTSQREYKDKLFSQLQLAYEGCSKDSYEEGHMPDIYVDNVCFIDIKARSRGIITLKDKEAIHKCMTSLKWPGVEIIFFSQSFIVILWFGFKNGNTIIEAESIGTDESGASLIDLV